MFYSWQSDLPGNRNRSLIERALARACKTLSAHAELDVAPDRDTAGVAGSPDIAATILRKIGEASAFVADVSIVTPTLGESGERPGGRPSPNPNVMLEVGYAKGTLGEGAVVLVMNTDHGPIDLLPFDLRGRRVIPYSPAGAGSNTAAENALTQRLVEALQPILDVAHQGPPPIADQTEATEPTPVGSLDRMNRVLGWGNTPEELEHTIGTVEALFDQVRRVPTATRQFLVVMLRRMKRGEVLYSELQGVTGLSSAEVDDHLRILDWHGIATEPDLNGRDQVVTYLIQHEWPIWDAIVDYTQRTEVTLEEIVVDLHLHRLS